MKLLLIFSIMVLVFSMDSFAETISKEINCELKATLRFKNINEEVILKSFVLKDKEEIITENLLVKFFKGEDNYVSIFFYTRKNLFIAGSAGTVTTEHPVSLLANTDHAQLINYNQKLILLSSRCQFIK